MANSTFTKSLDMLNTVGLRESIQTLMKKESKYIPVATVCKDYLKKLDEGKHEEEIVNDFVNDLSKVAVHESAKDVLYSVSKKLDENKRDIDMINKLHEMNRGQYGYIVPMIESSLVNYMSEKNAETRTAARQSLSLFEGIKEVNEILESLSFDEYEEKTNKTLHNVSLNESMLPQAPKTFTQDEVDEMLKEAKAEQQPVAPQAKRLSDIDTHINLDYTIKKILKNSTNEGLKAFCEQYTNALNMGKAEETLYESFISGISRWNYLSAVDTETSALKDRVSKYQQDIDLKKILKVMESTGSYYIVPLIENVVVDYMANKSMTNKQILKQRLQAFEYDPFVRDILNVVMLDQSLENTVYLGESVERINNIVHTEKVYSPVKYVKENECIFNVKGTYYTRKGNTITKLAKSSVENLDESFRTLCNLINHPAVKIDGEANVISIYEGSDSAKISETSIEINGTPVSEQELERLAQNSHLMNEHKEGFYAATKMINENFDKIAYIDFVKRLSMNESSNGKSVDVFRIKNNIFVNTSNAALGTSTFYRNVNPIQCRSYINEHMELNVSSLFEDILPNQHAILEGIEETKKQYEDYIEELNNKKEEFEKMKETSEDTADIDKAIKIIEDELKDVQKKYDDYQKDSEKYVTGDEKDAETDDPANPAQFEPSDDEAGDNEEPTETEDQMTQPISGDAAPTENPAEDAFADPDQEAIDSATPYDPDFDVAAGAAPGKDTVQVLRVSYSTNIKTGKMLNQGTAFVVIPSVDANGDIKDETKTVTFYLDTNRKPILNNEYMPLSIYNAIVSAISADSDTANVEVAGATDNIEAAGDAGTPSTVDTPEGAEDLLGGNADNVEASLTVTATAPAEGEPAPDLGTEPAPAPAPETPSEAPAPEGPATEPVSPEGPAVDEPAPADASLSEPIGELPSQEDVDGMFGVNPEDETDDIPQGGYINFDDDNAAPAEGEPAPAEEPATEPAPAEEAPAADEPIDAAPQEGPAETESRSEDAEYPIELGLNLDDIKPIKKEAFMEACKDMCIECGIVEGEDNSVTLNFANKAAVYALKDYFKEWKNFSDSQFITFFPELQKCFKNQPKVPVAPAKANESVKILGVNAINESVLYGESNKGTVKVVLPYNDEYAKMFGQKRSSNASHIEIVTESFDETKELYNTLNNYSARKNGEIDEDAKQFLTKYRNDFKEIADSNVYTLNVPFNGFLEQKLEAKGIPVSRVDENLSIAVDKDNVTKAKKVFESVYGGKTPLDVKNFFQLSEKSLKEGVVITVEDTKTGKTVKINTDDVDSGNSSDEKKEEADPFKDVTTTFNASDSALFASEDEDSDEGKKDEEEEKKDQNVEGQNEGEGEENNTEESSEEETKEEKKKPKFKFRAKKKEEPTQESVKTPKKQEALNESEGCKQAAPNVMDYVILDNGLRGQILSKLPMSDNFVVVTDQGRTIEVSPKSMKLAKEKFDCVDAPYKFDPATLKGLFEQMVQCGLFMNGNQLTPNDCYVKYSEYAKAGAEDDVRMIIENEQTFAKKKFIRILEDVNDFANVNDYVEGVEVASSGIELRNILFNIKDYEHASGSASPVKVLVTDEEGNKNLIYLPVASVRPVEM